ncbi:hypothetical protein DL95DRAFT_529818 [Leptodontidium sp. 2 PMI_412]|nr:hypothetical protein DL95DRAFT_529818 [Leptodontidium sp. 2 PMI_412]
MSRVCFGNSAAASCEPLASTHVFDKKRERPSAILRSALGGAFLHLAFPKHIGFSEYYVIYV